MKFEAEKLARDPDFVAVQRRVIPTDTLPEVPRAKIRRALEAVTTALEAN